VKPVRWGILSTARINERVLPGAHASPHVELVAVASRSQESAEAFAREWDIPTAHRSYEDLLADPQVEAVYIPLPNSFHVEWSVRALEAGKHVLCEKPLDRRPAEVERAFDVAEDAGLILMEAFMYRHHPQTRLVAELVTSGAIGELRLVRSSFSFLLDDEENVRMRPELDGGALMDVGCYPVSIFRLLAGEPVAAIGSQVTGTTGVDVRFLGTLVFPEDTLAQFDCGFDLPFRTGVEVVGSTGVVRVADPFLCTEPAVEIVREDGVERRAVPDDDKYQLEFENMSAAVRGEAEPLLGRADALGQARAIDALYRSAELGGEPVPLA
jgi:xylose dehydrogenase (NAD/NADP)